MLPSGIELGTTEWKWNDLTTTPQQFQNKNAQINIKKNEIAKFHLEFPKILAKLPLVILL